MLDWISLPDHWPIIICIIIVIISCSYYIYVLTWGWYGVVNLWSIPSFFINSLLRLLLNSFPWSHVIILHNPILIKIYYNCRKCLTTSMWAIASYTSTNWLYQFYIYINVYLATYIWLYIYIHTYLEKSCGNSYCRFVGWGNCMHILGKVIHDG